MKKFIESYRLFKKLKSIGEYRLCWIPMTNGNGLWSCVVFFDDELAKIDKYICEICVY